MTKDKKQNKKKKKEKIETKTYFSDVISEKIGGNVFFPTNFGATI